MPFHSNSLENISEVNTSRMQAQEQRKETKNEMPSTRFQRSTQSYHKESPGSMGKVHIKIKNSGCNNANNNSELTERTSLGNSQDLSHDDLLLLLSILEGELQARDEVITVLRAEKIDLALLEANYGFVTSPKVLQALQRDTTRSKGHCWREDIYEKPIAELDKLVEKQKETYRVMLEQLLQVEQAHRQTLYRLEDEKQNHKEYMKKSDEFTALLEHEGERLKLLNQQEKSHQKQTEEENNIKVAKLKDELTKLKSFALLVIDEQQHATEQLAQQSTKVWELQATAREAQEELNSVRTRAQKMENKVLHLEAELSNQSVQFHQQQEAMSNKLADENRENRQLHQKLATLTQKIGELEKLNKTLCRAGEELQKLKDKKGEGNGNYILVSEVEDLRKRVVEMEEKDEELVKMENLCTDLKRKLEKESTQNCSLRTELDKLDHRVLELEELDNVCAENKQECSSLKCNLEKEQAVTKHMCNELDNLRIRIKELEAAESLLQKTEWTLKEDITKLKTLTVMLVNERKNMAEKLKQLENKVQDSTAKLQVEQDKVTSVTEKLIKESKKALKIKVEMEEKLCIATKESNDLKIKLKSEEDKNKDLQSEVSLMEKRLQSMEAVEREFLRNKAKEENMKSLIKNGFQQEDNKLKDLTQEVEWLRRKVSKMNVVEKDLLKTQNESDSLENGYSNEKALREELETTKNELSKYQLVEKENLNQELILYKQLKEEEVKSSNLAKEVEALKEKIHNYMGIEESICNMKTEYATLQRKLTQQEIRNKELVREKESLTREVERYHRFSKSLRPGMIGRRLSDLQVSTKEVQTESTDSPTSTSKKPSIPEESNQQYEHNSAKCSTSHNHLNDSTKYGNLVSESIEKQHFNNCNLQNTQNGPCIQQEHIIVTHNLSQPLHIKVTPNYSPNTSTPKITNSTTENVQPYINSTTESIQTYTTTTVPPNIDCTRKQVTLIHNPPVSPQNNKCHTSIKGPMISELLKPDCVMSSTKMSTITGDSDKVQKSKVEPGNTVYCVMPQRQNDWHAQRYNRAIQSVLSKKDKLHIHLGISCPQTTNGNTEPACSPGQEQRTTISAKVDTKIAGSIMKPPSTSIPQPIQFTVPVEAFQQSGPTKIPKPKAYITPMETNSRTSQTQRTGTAQALPKLGKNNYMTTENLFTMS
ncbi:Filamin A-interacting protein 1-like [Bagarius yarrelli]|uniref:Filamin A-interacting protein 1-like n=1 Tax=Bagarius yarrelli TaxID=175774 RepID=A0A556V7E9_BAGYA|nr:Filamin A-interacting protein 1-like [Bagarius yarrelli]